MEKTVRILIFIIVIIIAALGIGWAFILKDNKLSHNNTTKVSNQTNISVNNTTNNNQTSKTNYISASEAIEIAKSAASIYPDNRTRFTAEFIDGNPPIWHVIAWQNDPKSEFYGQNIGGAKVNAITGELISAMG